MTYCPAVAVRPGGERVLCNLPAGHGGPWHIGRASNIDRYTWPNVAQKPAPTKTS